MTPFKSIPVLAITILPIAALGETVFDTGEDIYAEDGPWMAIPADFDPKPPTAADIIAMANLDGDLLTITAEERDMIAMLTQVLIASDTPVTP